MSTTPPPERSEEELRAAYEQEIRSVRVEHILIDGVVTLVNLGMRRTGLMPGTEAERDPAQVHLAIEAVRAHAPLVEAVAPEHAKSIRDALSQLQLAYVRIGGQGMPDAAAGEPPPGPGAGASVPGAGAPVPGAGAPLPGAGAPLPGGEAPAAGAGAGAGTVGPAAPPPPPKPGEAGPAQRSGRLWVPGS